MVAGRARGFTLIELLVVMVILGITLGIVSLNDFALHARGDERRMRKIAETLAAICDALDCQPGDLLEYAPETGREEVRRAG